MYFDSSRSFGLPLVSKKVVLMVAIPVPWSGPRRSGLFERLLASLSAGGVAEREPRRHAARNRSTARRAVFLEHAAMSREMHRL